jgi:hypothetical protein
VGNYGMTVSHSPADALYEKAQGRIRLLGEEVEAWKRDHKVAMECLSLQETLRFGIEVYHALHRIDEELRDRALSGSVKFTEKTAKRINDFFRDWLKPGEMCVHAIAVFSKKNYHVENADEFLAAYREALWIVMPASKMFDHPKMVELRDRAIDDLRAGKCLPAE